MGTVYDIDDNGVTEPEPAPVPRRPRRWPFLAVAAVVVAGGSIAALTLTSSPPAPSAACRHAVAVQNDYVDEQVALGYPDSMGIDQGMTVITVDIGLLNNLSKAGCPGNTLVHVLPSGN